MENKNDYNKLNGKRITNFGLAGLLLNSNTLNRMPLEKGHVYTREELWKSEVEYLLKNVKDEKGLNALGAKFNEAIDNKYDIDDGVIWDYQLCASKKMTEINNKYKESKVV
jgi:hypothetical protein